MVLDVEKAVQSPHMDSTKVQEVFQTIIKKK